MTWWLQSLEEEHETQENMVALDKILKEHFGSKKKEAAEELGCKALKLSICLYFCLQMPGCCFSGEIINKIMII